MSQGKVDLNYYKFSNQISKELYLAEYIWIDESGLNMKSQTQIYNQGNQTIDTLDWLVVDGSQQKPIHLKPCCVVRDPFRGKPHVLVLCESYLEDRTTPASQNYRWLSKQVMQLAEKEHPQFGIEQEYYIYSNNSGIEWPYCWPIGGFPNTNNIGRYFSAVGDGNNFGRAINEAHLRCCLNAGIKIGGANSEAAPSQQEFQIGICNGIEIGDHLWLARYILVRIAELFDVQINFEPKPLKGNMYGSGGHCNLSTDKTRSDGGYEYMIKEIIPLLEHSHKELLHLYGQSNEKRMCGTHCTSSLDKFSFGVGADGAAQSIRIPEVVSQIGKGYLEDRRPGANIDPYLVSGVLIDIICLGGAHMKQFNELFDSNNKEQSTLQQ